MRWLIDHWSIYRAVHRPVSEVGPETPGHQAEEEANAAGEAQDEPGLERDADAGGPSGAAGQVQPWSGGAEPGREQQRGGRIHGPLPAGATGPRNRPPALEADAGQPPQAARHVAPPVHLSPRPSNPKNDTNSGTPVSVLVLEGRRRNDRIIFTRSNPRYPFRTL